MLTKTYVAASTGKIILSAVTPVFDEKDTVVGVVGIDVGLDTVMNMMGNYTIGANGYSMLLTSDGTFGYEYFRQCKHCDQQSVRTAFEI